MGQVFYYNEETGDFQWVDPNLDPEDEQNQSEEGVEDARVSESLRDWRAYKDPETGSVFWHNAKTNVSQWECPGGEGISTVEVDDSSHNNGRKNGRRRGREEQDVVQVQSDDDLGI